jgi:hypothetical protein
MTRLWTVVAIAPVVALVAVPAGYAAYTPVKFGVTQAGTTTTIKASVDPTGDPTAMLQIIVPSVTQVTTNQAPGTALGQVRAVVRALDLASADLQLEGKVLVAAPGQVSAAVREACVATTPVTATWVLALSAGGRELVVPAFFVAWPGPFKNIYVCFSPPDAPVGTPGRAPFGAKLSSFEATFTDVFSVSACIWIGAFSPYTPLVGEVNWFGTVGLHDPKGPGAVNLTARTAGAGASLVGRVTQGGVGLSDATVRIFGGSAPGKLRSLGTARVAFDGAFTFRTRTGTFFRAKVVAASGQCFKAQSGVVRKR